MTETSKIEYNEIEQTALDDGRRHTFRTKTRKSFDPFKKDLELEFKLSWAGGFGQWTWRDHTCHITSPGPLDP